MASISVLTTESGIETTNTIYLNGDAWNCLTMFERKLRGAEKEGGE
jgi:hypothetical protein